MFAVGLSPSRTTPTDGDNDRHRQQQRRRLRWPRLRQRRWRWWRRRRRRRCCCRVAARRWLLYLQQIILRQLVRAENIIWGLVSVLHWAVIIHRTVRLLPAVRQKNKKKTQTLSYSTYCAGLISMYWWERLLKHIAAELKPSGISIETLTYTRVYMVIIVGLW